MVLAKKTLALIAMVLKALSLNTLALSGLARFALAWMARTGFFSLALIAMARKVLRKGQGSSCRKGPHHKGLALI